MIPTSLAPIIDSLSTIAPALANHLWQSTAFALAAWLVTLLLRSNAARVRYVLWLAASLKFLIPFSLLVSLGALLPRPQHVVATAPIDTAVDAVALPFSDNVIAVSPVIVQPSRSQLLLMVLAALWVCGGLVVLAVWYARWRSVAATRRRAVLPNGGREFDVLRRVSAAVAPGKAPIPLLLSPELMEPGIVGILRTVLLWPTRLTDRLDDPHIEAILAHELMHVRRRDNLAAALHMLVETLFWFHPLVWFIERRMVEERERACDQAVVQLGSAPGIYADSLLKACRFCVESPLACVSGITGADLNRRVRSIMTLRLARLTLPRKLLLMSLALAAIAAPIAFGVLHAVPTFGQILHATGPLPSFEVATIRPMEQMGVVAPPGGGVPPASGRVAPNGEQIISQQEVRISPSPRFSDRVNSVMTAKMLIDYAYNLPAFSESQIIGGPDWTSQTMYQIHAKIDDLQFAVMQKMSSAQQTQQIQLMQQSLLAERFKLKAHFETRQMPVYALELAKGGPKLTPAKGEGAAPQAQPTIMSVVSKGDGLNEITAKEVQPSQLILMLQNQPELGHRMIIDKTGLTGHYDLTLDWAREGPATAEVGSANADAAPSLFTALKEELGLQLVETKGPAEVLVIDSIERPSVDGAELPAAGMGRVGAVAGAKARAFDVTSIRPSNSGSQLVFWGVGGTGYSTLNAPLGRVILDAYLGHPNLLPVGPPLDRLKGAPAWVMNAPYDITAKADEATIEAMKGLDQRQQLGLVAPMLRAMLEDRLKLVAHTVPVDVPGYALVVSKHGVKMKETPPDEPMPAYGLSFGGSWKVVFRRAADGRQSGNAYIGITMAELAASIGSGATPVVDQTGLTGKYDVELAFMYMDSSGGTDGSVPQPRPDIAHVYDWEAIGLEMKPIKAPVPSVVIDHIERPSEN
jgi:uncharacterized protein (TIGR03435 family)